MSKIPRLSTSSSTRRSRFASSFVRLNMKPNTGAGPINRLPNEMMQMIVAKLGLDGNVHELVRLRLVSTKWRAVIEDYCGQKKSLLVVMDPLPSSKAVYDIAEHKEHVKNNFFGFGNSKDFARLVLVPKFSYRRLTSLLKIFPNIVQLSIDCWASTEATYFVVYINSLASLKQLNLYGSFSPDQFAQSAILSKLEHFSIYPISARPSSNQSSMQLVTQLGPSCVRFKFIFMGPPGRPGSLDSNDIFQWHTNRLWLTNLTHLAIRFGSPNEHLKLARVVPYLSEHATSLKHLSFEVSGFRPLELSPAVIGHLAKLTHLAELAVCNIAFHVNDLKKLAAEARLTPLSSVLTCKLRVHFNGVFVLSADRFTRGLSTIFPNLDDLDLTIVK